MLNLFSNPLIQMFFIIIATLVVNTIIEVGIKFSTKKGINLKKDIQVVDNALTSISPVIDAADKALNTPWLHTIKFIKDQCVDAVHESEQLYLSAQLDKESRNAQAKQSIYNILKLAKIEVTPEVESLINMTIEKECKAIGHTDTDSKIIQNQLQQTNQQLQSQLDSKIKELQEAQGTVTNLTQKLNSIQLAVQ